MSRSDGGSHPEENGARGQATSKSEKSSYKTIQHDARPPRASSSFATKLTTYFALTAIMCAVLLSCVLAFTWEGQFKTYTRENMQRLAQSTAEGLAERYSESRGWTEDALSYARSASATSSDIAVQVLDADGTVIYDDVWSNSERGGRSVSVAPTNADSVVTADIVTPAGKHLGSVRLWAFGSEALVTKADAAFRENSYKAIVMAACIAVIIACVIGYLASRMLTKPIKRITTTATQIRNGDLSARCNLRGEDEIGRLGETFDSMATELEKDIKFEHRLTSDVAHELRTPLMAMQATVEAMQDGVLPADDEHLEVVDSEVRRLSRLVDAMLHLSRVENGKASFKWERTDVVYLVRNLVSMQEQLFEEKGLHLRFDDRTPDHECNADINPDLIREAVTNLMSNALRYTPSGGWVVVAVERDRMRGEVLISVRDTGIGIAKEDIPRVFSRFWRSDASRERVSGGLGVGLALTKEIIDQHNGTISVESELGRGTTFTLRIPTDRTRRSLKQSLSEK